MQRPQGDNSLPEDFGGLGAGITRVRRSCAMSMVPSSVATAAGTSGVIASGVSLQSSSDSAINR